MPTKSDKNKSKKVTKTVNSSKKSTAGKKTKAVNTRVNTNSQLFFSALGPKITSTLGNFKNITVFIKENKNRVLQNKKITYSLTAVAGLLILGFLAYKYLVVAWVDYYPVTRIELYRELEDQYGVEIKDNLITERLILNEARKRGVSVSNEEIQDELTKLEAQQGGAEQLNQILTMQNISRSELERRFKFRILVNKMFGMNAVVSEEEINNYIEQNKDQILALGGQQPQTDAQGNVLAESQPGTVSAQLRQEIKDQLMQQKVSDDFTKWLEEAKKSARVRRV